jgi:hypothetical protein
VGGAPEGTGVIGVVTIAGVPDTEFQAADLSQKVTVFDDFLAAAIDARWSSSEGSGGGGEPATKVTDAINGEITLKTETTETGHSTDVSNITLDERNFQADQGGLVMEARIKLASAADVAVFVGFTDVISTTVEMPIFKTSAADTIDSDAQEACGVCFDTQGTTQEWFHGGVANDVDTAPGHSGGGADTNYVVIRVEVSAAGAVQGYIDGVAITGGAIASAVTVSDILTPVIAVVNRGAAGKTLTIDYIWVQQNR